MRWFNWLRKQKKKEERKEFLQCSCVKDINKLEGNERLIVEGIAYGFKTTLKTIKATVPFDIYRINEEKLLEFKNNFGFRNKQLRHQAYIEWMADLGLVYEKDRAVVSKIIRGIYEYTNGKLDYRNSSMIKKDNNKEMKIFKEV